MAALCVYLFLENNLACVLLPYCAIIRYSRVPVYCFQEKILPTRLTIFLSKYVSFSSFMFTHLFEPTRLLETYE